MKIFIGADHRGFEMKEAVKAWLGNAGHEVVDQGNTVYDKDDDFPDYTFAVADAVARDHDAKGIVICGSAGGVTIAANKVKGIRCTTGVGVSDVAHNRAHDDINVLALSSDFTSIESAKSMIETFLGTAYLGQERHVRRLQKVTSREDSWEK